MKRVHTFLVRVLRPSLRQATIVGDNGRERGVALLLTLGVLSLLLILAMSFAFTSRTERMASSVNADLIKARLLCESGLERVLGSLRNACSTGVHPSPGTEFFYAPDTGSLWAGRRYLASINNDRYGIETALAVDFGSLHFTPFQPYAAGGVFDSVSPSGCPTCPPTRDTVGWVSVWSDPATSSDLIGRICFVAIDESGKIDPGAVVSTDINEAVGNETVVGRDVKEIQLGGMGFPLLTGNEFRDQMPAGKRWFSMYHIAKGITPTMGTPDWESCLAGFFPGTRFEPEQWRETPLATNPDDKDRFDVASGTTPSMANLASKVPWLNSVQDKDGNPVSNQVKANVVDFLDSDDTATSDWTDATGDWPVVPTGGAPSATYVGLEKVPYINEIGITATLTEVPIPPAVDGTSEYTLDVVVYLELINIYNTAKTCGATVLVDFPEAPANGVPAGAIVTVAGSSTASTSGAKCVWTAQTVPANNYLSAPSITTTFTWKAASNGNIAAFTVSAVAAKVTDGTGNLWDFAWLGGAPAAPGLTPGPNPISASWQVNDPRCNTAEARWAKNGFVSLGAGSTLGARNVKPDGTDANFARPSGRGPGDDYETTDDPAGKLPAPPLSTAFVRNGPMLSLWELGCIHRGEPWRTLNLAKFNGAASNATANKYSDGDANILDQVCMGDNTVTARGKFNVNSGQAPAWRTLLGSTTVGGRYLDPKSGIRVSADDAKLLAADVLANGTGKSVNAVINRGGVAKAPALSDGSVILVATYKDPDDTTKTKGAQEVDRGREEIIGKIAGLLSTRMNYFTVIVDAQSVKDLGTVPEAMPASARQASWVKYDTAGNKWCDVRAEQKILAIVSRNVFTNTFKVEAFQYLEE